MRLNFYNKKNIALISVFILLTLIKGAKKELNSSLNEKEGLSEKISTNEDQKWCWTQSMANEPGFKLDLTKGGINWGICQNKPVPNMITYTVKTIISSIPGSGTKSKIKLTLFGTKGKSNEFDLLSQGQVEDGDEDQNEFKALDVGDLEKISIKLLGNDDFRCNSIEINTPSGLYTFECIQPLTTCLGFDYSKCLSFLKPSGNTLYEISLKPDEKHGIYNFPIILSVVGQKGQSSFGVISNIGITSTELFTKKMYLESVGSIIGFEIRIFDQGTFEFSQLTITNAVTSEKKEFELEKVTLTNPGKSLFFYREPISEENNEDQTIKPQELDILFDDEDETQTNPTLPSTEEEKLINEHLRENSKNDVKKEKSRKNGFNK
jgi:hypothetical protein